MDETILSLHPPLRACWMKRGRQKRIPTPGTQRRHHLFGAYLYGEDTICWTSSEQRKTSQSCIEFLEYLLLETYPERQFVLVMENASIHKSKASLAALSLFEHRLQVNFLPAYCSFINPIERYWRHLKDRICVNKLFPDMEELRRSVDRELQAQNHMDNPQRFSLLMFKP